MQIQLPRPRVTLHAPSARHPASCTPPCPPPPPLLCNNTRDVLSPHHSPRRSTRLCPRCSIQHHHTPPTPQPLTPHLLYPRQAAMITCGAAIPHRAEQEAPMRAPLSPQPARPRLATAHAGALLASLARRPGLKLGTHAPVPNLASGVCVHALLARVVLERPVPLRHLEQRLHVRVRVSCEQVACARSPRLMESSVRARTAARGARHASQRPAP